MGTPGDKSKKKKDKKAAEARKKKTEQAHKVSEARKAKEAKAKKGEQKARSRKAETKKRRDERTTKKNKEGRKSRVEQKRKITAERKAKDRQAKKESGKATDQQAVKTTSDYKKLEASVQKGKSSYRYDRAKTHLWEVDRTKDDLTMIYTMGTDNVEAKIISYDDHVVEGDPKGGKDKKTKQSRPTKQKKKRDQSETVDRTSADTPKEDQTPETRRFWDYINKKSTMRREWFRRHGAKHGSERTQLRNVSEVINNLSIDTQVKLESGQHPHGPAFAMEGKIFFTNPSARTTKWMNLSDIPYGNSRVVNGRLNRVDVKGSPGGDIDVWVRRTPSSVTIMRRYPEDKQTVEEYIRRKENRGLIDKFGEPQQTDPDKVRSMLKANIKLNGWMQESLSKGGTISAARKETWQNALGEFKLASVEVLRTVMDVAGNGVGISFGAGAGGGFRGVGIRRGGRSGGGGRRSGGPRGPRISKGRTRSIYVEGEMRTIRDAPEVSTVRKGSKSGLGTPKASASPDTASTSGGRGARRSGAPRRSGFEGEEIEAEFTRNRDRGSTTERARPGVDDIRERPNLRTSASNSPSAILGAELSRSGRPKPGPGYEAHHIVPQSDSRADGIRDFLSSKGIKPNDADNGVWLPRGPQTRNVGGEFRHEFTFKDEYFEGLQKVLMGNPDASEAQLRRALREIADSFGGS